MEESAQTPVFTYAGDLLRCSVYLATEYEHAYLYDISLGRLEYHRCTFEWWFEHYKEVEIQRPSPIAAETEFLTLLFQSWKKKIVEEQSTFLLCDVEDQYVGGVCLKFARNEYTAHPCHTAAYAGFSDHPLALQDLLSESQESLEVDDSELAVFDSTQLAGDLEELLARLNARRVDAS
jgi:hypothetical protein